ncbi:hypothetical protein QBC37DRAFT_461288 [Rhypophila decipiens]|uniref:Uncharacterized protein n=1 Tax=Rhypophila decipiens TaxID=261697 RepID=A0AAN6XV22_9PEZI|nr:hypothetical protein QBC37DRAFT_461288 [Rhypophila decipiens]
MTPTLLDNFNDGTVLLKLGQALWSWNICRESCRLHRYYTFYKANVSSYLEVSNSSRHFKSHQDIFTALQTIRSNPDITMDELSFQIRNWTGSAGSSPGGSTAAALTAKLLVMVEPSPLHQSSDRLEKGTRRTYWNSDTPFSKYIQGLFPVENHPILSSTQADAELLADMKSDLRATKLMKSLGITFRATYDISNHLRYDRKANVVEIFHHVAFLKEQLRATKGAGDCSIPSASIKMGSLPRPLVIESLVNSCSFDPEIMKFEFSSIRNPGEETITYIYFADRLSDIYNEVQNPRPRTWLERQVERKSGARYMMMATLIGVIFAVLLGMASLAVSTYQTWIAYQAWQHPVTPA